MHIVIPSHHRCELLFRALLHISPDRPMHIVRGGNFARNVNVGVASAFYDGAEHVLVMNDDVALDDEILGEIAVADGDVVYPAIADDGVPRLRGSELVLNRVVGVNMGLVEDEDGGSELDVTYVSAPDEPWIPHFACTRISRRAWEMAGPLCEEYENGWEDVEFLMRCRKADLHFNFLKPVEVAHDEYASRFVFDSTGALMHSKHNRELFMQRCGGLVLELLSGKREAAEAPAEEPATEEVPES